MDDEDDFDLNFDDGDLQLPGSGKFSPKASERGNQQMAEDLNLSSNSDDSLSFQVVNTAAVPAAIESKEASNEDMVLCLTWEDGKKKIRLDPTNPELKIGKKQANDIVVASSRISKFHCRIEYGRTLVDSNSKNGTKLNGVKITRAKLSPGDILEIGALTFEITADDTTTKKPQQDEQVIPSAREAAADPVRKNESTGLSNKHGSKTAGGDYYQAASGDVSSDVRDPGTEKERVDKTEEPPAASRSAGKPASGNDHNRKEDGPDKQHIDREGGSGGGGGNDGNGEKKEAALAASHKKQNSLLDSFDDDLDLDLGDLQLGLDDDENDTKSLPKKTNSASQDQDPREGGGEGNDNESKEKGRADGGDKQSKTLSSDDKDTSSNGDGKLLGSNATDIVSSGGGEVKGETTKSADLHYEESPPKEGKEAKQDEGKAEQQKEKTPLSTEQVSDRNPNSTDLDSKNRTTEEAKASADGAAAGGAAGLESKNDDFEDFELDDILDGETSDLLQKLDSHISAQESTLKTAENTANAIENGKSGKPLVDNTLSKPGEAAVAPSPSSSSSDQTNEKKIDRTTGDDNPLEDDEDSSMFQRDQALLAEVNRPLSDLEEEEQQQQQGHDGAAGSIATRDGVEERGAERGAKTTPPSTPSQQPKRRGRGDGSSLSDRTLTSPLSRSLSRKRSNNRARGMNNANPQVRLEALRIEVEELTKRNKRIRKRIARVRDQVNQTSSNNAMRKVHALKANCDTIREGNARRKAEINTIRARLKEIPKLYPVKLKSGEEERILESYRTDFELGKKRYVSASNKLDQLHAQSRRYLEKVGSVLSRARATCEQAFREREECSRTAQAELLNNRRLEVKLTSLLEKRTKSHDLQSTCLEVQRQVGDLRQRVAATHQVNVQLSSQMKALDVQIAETKKKDLAMRNRRKKDSEAMQRKLALIDRARMTLQRAQSMKEIGVAVDINLIRHSYYPPQAAAAAGGGDGDGDDDGDDDGTKEGEDVSKAVRQLMADRLSRWGNLMEINLGTCEELLLGNEVSMKQHLEECGRRLELVNSALEKKLADFKYT
eukprot:jgi/Bigna1/126808/aug1.3_g1516